MSVESERDAARLDAQRLREALDAITAHRRDGSYNDAETCRKIARAALAGSVSS